VGDRVVLSAGHGNIRECIALAAEYKLGIEIMAFAYPDLLDGDWRAAIHEYRALLRPVSGAITMHGPFMDMSPGSPDRLIAAATGERFRHALRIAHELEIPLIVLHANYLNEIHNEEYRVGWQKRNAAFWSALVEEARALGVTLAIENMWEFDPTLIGEIIKAVDHPNLRACLDIGHAHLYSSVPIETWLAVYQPYLVHVHLNNNDGADDVHRALGDGVVDFGRVLPLIRALPAAPTLTLEMDRVEDMRASLPFLEVGVTA
jgi:sugar phosphate isomerase/epimerase